jgi:cytoskeleton protein RodZ
MPNQAPDNFKLTPPSGAEPKPAVNHTDFPTLTERVNPLHETQLHLDAVPMPPEPSIPSLSALRLQKNESLETVASALRLKATQISALENQDWPALPGNAYIKGFLRSYCRFLNVSPDAYLAQYDASLQAPKHQSQTTTNPPPTVNHENPSALASFSDSAHQNKSHQTLLTALGWLVAGTLLFLVFWERDVWVPKFNALTRPSVDWFSQAVESLKNVPALTATQAKPVASDPSSTPPNAEQITKETPLSPAIGPMRNIVLKSNKPVWVEIRDSGNNVIYTGMRVAGVNDTIQGAAPLSVNIGVADAVTLTVDGQSFDVAAQAKQNVAKFSIQ